MTAVTRWVLRDTSPSPPSLGIPSAAAQGQPLLCLPVLGKRISQYLVAEKYQLLPHFLPVGQHVSGSWKHFPPHCLMCTTPEALKVGDAHSREEETESELDILVTFEEPSYDWNLGLWIVASSILPAALS